MNLPAVLNAPLPATYEAARTALAQCQAIDECKDWADKAAALASYAKQSEDLELEKMAARIRARAMRRAGELLKQVSGRGNNQHTDGADSKLVQANLARQAGMSERQKITAVRVANIPERDFAAQVESVNPPTLTELARQGTQKRDVPQDPESWLQGRSPRAFNAILHMTATIEEYAKEADTWPLGQLLTDMTEKERADVRKWIARIDSIHDHIMTRI